MPFFIAGYAFVKAPPITRLQEKERPHELPDDEPSGKSRAAEMAARLKPGE